MSNQPKHTPGPCQSCTHTDWQLGSIDFICNCCLQVEGCGANAFPVYYAAPELPEALEEVNKWLSDSLTRPLANTTEELETQQRVAIGVFNAINKAKGGQ